MCHLQWITNIYIYISALNKTYKTNIAEEHSYRPAIQKLIESVDENISTINEPKPENKRIRPDILIKNKEHYIGFVETKDIGKNLSDKIYKEQFTKYKNAFPNLIITDYLHFILYINGEEKQNVRIGEVKDDKIQIIKENVEKFNNLLNTFVSYTYNKPIKSVDELVKEMATKTLILKEELTDKKDILKDNFEFIKKHLVSKQTFEEFIDNYSQILMFGFLIKKLNGGKFPNSNTFLEGMFDEITRQLQDKIGYLFEIINNLFDSFDVEIFNKAYKDNDEILIYFYENFLQQYNRQERRNLGAWYTPQPIVDFMVRNTNNLIKQQFDVENGLLDSGIQILDPATGTGTFIVEIIKYIYQQKQNELGMWENYVKQNLLPRLNAFEISMVSHTLAHLKVEMLLKDYNVNLTTADKLNIYLTNSLANDKTVYLPFGQEYLKNEIQGAIDIKNNKNIKVIIGNPPYVKSPVRDQPEFIQNLAQHYKIGANAYPSNDLYWMFIRLGEDYTSRQQQGIMAYITNNSYLNGDTHYKMREHLLKTYDKIYIVDLHGEGGFSGFSDDKNVFNIQVGVAIAFFVKTGKKKANELAEVYYYGIKGTRESKFEFLQTHDLENIEFQKLSLPKKLEEDKEQKKENEHQEKNTKTQNSKSNINKQKYLFVPFKVDNEYEDEERFFKLTELMKTNSALTLTGYDDLVVNFKKQPLEKMIEEFKNTEIEDGKILNKDKLIRKYNIIESNWTLDNAIKDVKKNKTDIIPFNFRIFDYRYIPYSGTQSQGILFRPRKIQEHFVNHNNIGIIVEKLKFSGCIATEIPADYHTISSNFIFPLYLYNLNQKTTNFSTEIVKKIKAKVGEFEDIDLFDYVYGVLNDKEYEKKYLSYLKVDFPRIPYPKDRAEFDKFKSKGRELREIHLLQKPIKLENEISYPVSGDNIITKLEIKDGDKLYINDKQYIKGITQEVFNYEICKYPVIKNWFSARKKANLQLDNDDLQHIKKMVNAIKLLMERK